MCRSIRELAGARRPVRPSVLIAAVLVAALAGYWNPVAHAEEPLGDCWSEALSADPLHCYALEPSSEGWDHRSRGASTKRKAYSTSSSAISEMPVHGESLMTS